MNKRIILVGKAGSGKDFFKDYLKNLGYGVDVSYTTRPRREGEKEGETYHYITEYKFTQMEAELQFYESVSFNGWRYATTKRDWEDKKVCIKTPSGIKQLTDKDRKESIIIFFDIAMDVREERLKRRSDSDGVERRIKADEEDFKDFSLFDLRITNPIYDEEILEDMLENFSMYLK